MNINNNARHLIMVVEDVEETRDGLEKLLQVAGYQVAPARSVEDAIVQARKRPPDLVLLSLAGSPAQVTGAARQLQTQAGLAETVPVVIFCSIEVAEGTEVNIGKSVYLTRLDNFNQLKVFMRKLLPIRPT